MARRRTLDRTAQAVADALHDYDADFLECRRGNLGHEWRSLGFFRGAAGMVARRVVCKRCGTWRTDLWDAKTAERVRARYTYAEGYRIEGSQPDALSVRGEVLRRAVVFASEDEMLAAVTSGNGAHRAH